MSQRPLDKADQPLTEGCNVIWLKNGKSIATSVTRIEDSKIFVKGSVEPIEPNKLIRLGWTGPRYELNTEAANDR